MNEEYKQPIKPSIGSVEESKELTQAQIKEKEICNKIIESVNKKIEQMKEKNINKTMINFYDK